MSRKVKKINLGLLDKIMTNPKNIAAVTLLKCLKCPNCDRRGLFLTTAKFKHIPKDKNYILEGDWYIYKCSGCGEGFTTTESDTISQKNLKQKKL